jgi:hypothetical protein
LGLAGRSIVLRADGVEFVVVAAPK